MKEIKHYSVGNPWQQKVYKHMSQYLQKKGVSVYGISKNGTSYPHLLSKTQSELNFINKEIYEGTVARVSSHKMGDEDRIFTNTAASQPYCFNLIIYLQLHLYLADGLFSNLLNKPVKVIHLEPEFTPNKCTNVVGFENQHNDESIGDQGINRGTDSDVAVFYNYEGNKKGIILIEFKFIEAEFSTCSSFRNIKKADIRPICSSGSYYQELITNQNIAAGGSNCGYKKYSNWDLSKRSSVIDINKLQSASACPFRFGLNQLWRNMLLAEKVAEARELDEFHFWVLSPKANDPYLWRSGETESMFRSILTCKGNQRFQKVHLEDIFALLRGNINQPEDLFWLQSMEEKYLIE